MVDQKPYALFKVDARVYRPDNRLTSAGLPTPLYGHRSYSREALDEVGECSEEDRDA